MPNLDLSPCGREGRCACDVCNRARADLENALALVGLRAWDDREPTETLEDDAVTIARLRTENASLLARLEQAERDNDALRGQLATRTEALQTANATVASTRADRDAWRAKAEARPEIGRRDCARYVEYHQSMGMADDVHEPMKRIDAALRAHARKAVTG